MGRSKKHSGDRRVILRQAGVVCYALLIGAGLVVAASYAIRLLNVAPEFAQASDFFGYLQGANDVRAGGAPHGLRAFTFDSAHARLLRNYLGGQEIPLREYSGLLGPDGYHYQARSGLIVNQYPPGVAYLLAAFPRGAAFHDAAYILLGLLLAGAFCTLIAAVMRWRERLAAAVLASGFSGLAVVAALMMFGISASYSIDLFCLPMLCAMGFAHWAMSGERRWNTLAALLAGAVFGFAILARLATASFLPGFLVLLWPVAGRGKFPFKPMAFLLGTLVAGIVPLLIHQHALTGWAFTATYIGDDTKSPSVAYVVANGMYYFLGAGNLFVLTFLGAAGCFYGVLYRCWRSQTPTRLRRYAQAIVVFWLVPTGYFLSHFVVTDYYQLPTLLVCLLAMGFGAWTLPSLAGAGSLIQPRVAIGGAAILALLIGWRVLTLPPLPTVAQMRPPNLDVPVSLKNPEAWIFADRFSGTLWYYHGIAAGAIVHTSARARLRAYQFIFARHEPVLVLKDNPAVEPIVEELRGMGAAFEDGGRFGREPVLRVVWPAGGPRGSGLRK